MKHAIEEFSSIFAFGHSASSSTEDGDLCFEIYFVEVLYYPIFESVKRLGLMHQESFFATILEMMKKEEFFASKEKFMSFVLSRCMKLSETPTLFSFLVLCTFVDKVVNGICSDVECFRVIKMASKCVTAAFYRRYVDLFDKENGFQGFSEYCEKLKATVLHPSEDSLSGSEESLDLEGFISPDTDGVIDLLKSFEEIDDSEFLLNDFEKKLLYERDELPLNIDPTEDIFIPLDDSSESSENKSLDLAIQNLNIKSERVLERLNLRCLICKDNCYKHVVLVAKELEACEI